MMQIGEKLVECTAYWDIETEIVGRGEDGGYSIRRKWKWRGDSDDSSWVENVVLTGNQFRRLEEKFKRIAANESALLMGRSLRAGPGELHVCERPK